MKKMLPNLQSLSQFYRLPDNVVLCYFFPGSASTQALTLQVLVSLHSSILNGLQPLRISCDLDVCEEYRSVIL